MKILVFMKRYGVHKDMVLDGFGRQIQLFKPLASKHQIDFLCPDYKKKEFKIIKKFGIKFTIVPFSLLHIKHFMDLVKTQIAKNNYDAVFGTSDPLIGILSYFYSNRFDIPFIYDLQDNYEIYSAYKIPFVKYFDKKVIKKSDLVLTVSDSLNRKISRYRSKPTITVQNGYDEKLFFWKNKNKARKKFNLSKSAKIVIYIGEISALKGANTLLKAFEIVKKKDQNALLILSGKIKGNININKPGIVYKTLPKRNDVVNALNASDTAVIPNIKNKFSKFCFPYKLVEYIACGLPIVATDIGDISNLLKNYPNSLCKPEDSNEMAKKILFHFKNIKKNRYKKEIDTLKWSSLASKVEKSIIKLNTK